MRARKDSTSKLLSSKLAPPSKAPFSRPSIRYVSNWDATVNSCAIRQTSAAIVSNRVCVWKPLGIVSSGSCSVFSRFGFLCGFCAIERCCVMSFTLGSSAKRSACVVFSFRPCPWDNSVLASTISGLVCCMGVWGDGGSCRSLLSRLVSMSKGLDSMFSASSAS